MSSPQPARGKGRTWLCGEIKPALKQGRVWGWDVPRPHSRTQLLFQPFHVVFPPQPSPGRGKALLDDGENSPGEGKASCNFFHIKCDVCFGMTQAGSHHPYRRAGRAPGPAGLGPSTLALQGDAWGVIISLNHPVCVTAEFRALIAVLGVGGSVPVRDAMDAEALLVLMPGAGRPMHGADPHGCCCSVCARSLCLGRGCLSSRSCCCVRAMLSASEGSPKPQRRDVLLYPESAWF